MFCPTKYFLKVTSIVAPATRLYSSQQADWLFSGSLNKVQTTSENFCGLSAVDPIEFVLTSRWPDTLHYMYYRPVACCCTREQTFFATKESLRKVRGLLGKSHKVECRRSRNLLKLLRSVSQLRTDEEQHFHCSEPLPAQNAE